MPSKIKRRGSNSFLLSVVHRQKEYTKTVHASSMEEAKQQYTLFAAEVLKGRALSGDTKKMTLDVFHEYWIKHYSNGRLSPASVALNDFLYQRIGKALGHLRIDKIEARHILNFIDQLRQPDASAEDQPLSQVYIKKHLFFLKQLFSEAVRWDFVLANPVEKVAMPKVGRQQKKIPSEAEIKNFLSLLTEHPIFKHRLWTMLAFSLGLRREEIFGLQWGDIGLDTKTLAVNRAVIYVSGKGIIEKSAKSDGSHRKLSLPADMVAMFKEWKEEVITAAKRKAKRQKVVALDNPAAPGKWVFAQPNGGPGHPHAFNAFLRRFCLDNGLPIIGPHTFRHLSGSYLIRSGVDVATVSALLGHANKGFTMNTYVHELQSAKEAAAITMQAVLQDLQNGIKKEGQAQ